MGIPWAMTSFPRLLAILAIVLPPGSGDGSNDAALKPSTTVVSVGVLQSVGSSLGFTASHLPSPVESFYERLDEMACDEEDSSRVEDHGVLALSSSDYGAPLASGPLALLSPASSHTPPVVIAPILRC
jgi:hypothetical protein